MTKSIQSRARDAFALVLLVPLVLGGLGIWTARRYRENIELVSHTQTVLSAID
jgi:CHASE3 domain sensor protein